MRLLVISVFLLNRYICRQNIKLCEENHLWRYPMNSKIFWINWRTQEIHFLSPDVPGQVNPHYYNFLEIHPGKGWLSLLQQELQR